MNRKLTKLRKTPRLFFRDMAAKRTRFIVKRLPRFRTIRGRRRYSVVAAVYGVEGYLDDFFRSMVRQSLRFDDHIELIMVDDGSLDSSADIIRKWQQTYPRSIRYLRKRNGGQASARNWGLPFATGEWVTFIDPDDFIHERYFEQIDRFLDRTEARNLALISCNYLMYDERSQRVHDAHPLRYRFRDGNRVVSITNLENDLQLSTNSALFRRDLLSHTELRFDESIRPCFEDAHFVNRYLLSVSEMDAAFLPSAKYFYRKRADRSSTLDGSWNDRDFFGTVLEKGCLDLFRYAASQSPDGRIPTWVQRAVLYHLVWYFKRIVNNETHVSLLSSAEQSHFKALLQELISQIDQSVIMSFGLGGAWLFHKIGWLSLYKSSKPSFQQLYVGPYDPDKRMLMVRYFHGDSSEMEVFSVDGVETYPVFAKDRRHDLLGETFVLERIAWLPIESTEGRLRAEIGGLHTRIVRNGRVYESFPLDELAKTKSATARGRMSAKAAPEYRLAKSPPLSKRYRDAFIFMDRDTHADDNAEHLYRYVRSAYPEVNAFFVLRRTSHDWERLAREGFRLLPFGSFAHRIALLNAKHVISSHVDHYVVTHPSGRAMTRLMSAKFTFLQHGVTKDDLSNWLNGKEIDCFVTASAAEYESIVSSRTPYKFCEKEVVLSGFPRHDALVPRLGQRSDELLLIMPTWRQSAVGKNTGKGSAREVDPRFFDTAYAKTWKAFLHSSRLHELVSRHRLRVIFVPHVNLEPYVDGLEIPGYIDVVRPGRDGSMQGLFGSAKVMLTDYSSTAFEMAFLKKPVVYYQFDRELVFGGGHSYRRGYFDYDRDGFGPVCHDEESACDAISAVLSADGVPSPVFRARMDKAFAFRDGRSCERTFDAIMDLDRPNHSCERSHQLLVESARTATKHAAWFHAELRWARIFDDGASGLSLEAGLHLCQAKRMLRKVDEAAALLRELEARHGSSAELQYEWAEVASLAGLWVRASTLWSQRTLSENLSRTERQYALIRLAEAYRMMGALEEAQTALEQLSSEPYSASVAADLERAELATAMGDWPRAAQLWQQLSADTSAPRHCLLQLAYALVQLNSYEAALEAVGTYLNTEQPEHELEARTLRLRLSTAGGAPVSAVSVSPVVEADE